MWGAEVIILGGVVIFSRRGEGVGFGVVAGEFERVSGEVRERLICYARHFGASVGGGSLGCVYLCPIRGGVWWARIDLKNWKLGHRLKFVADIRMGGRLCELL